MEDKRDIEEEFEEFMNSNNFKTVGEFIAAQTNDSIDNYVNTGKIFDHNPRSFFSEYNERQRNEWYEVIDQLSPIDLITDLSIDDNRRNVIRKWLSEYQDYRIQEKMRTYQPAYYNTVNEQLLILHFLKKAEIIRTNKIHQDRKKQARVLAALLNRGADKFYDHYKKFESTSYSEKYFSKENLLKVKELFMEAELNDVIQLIDKEISNLTS